MALSITIAGDKPTLGNAVQAPVDRRRCRSGCWQTLQCENACGEVDRGGGSIGLQVIHPKSVNVPIVSAARNADSASADGSVQIEIGICGALSKVLPEPLNPSGSYCHQTVMALPRPGRGSIKAM
jgi:hypothetical protein